MTLTEHIISVIGLHPKGISADEVMACLRKDSVFPDSSYFNILYRLVREDRVIKKDSKLFPSRSFKPTFHINPDAETAKLYTELQQQIPFTELCIWNTIDIMPLMHDIPNFNLTIISVARNAIDSVVDILDNLTDRLVLRDQDKDILSRFAPGRELVIVTPLISQSPTEIIEGITCPTLEKILVDILCNNSLYALTGSEAYAIYANAFDRYAINIKNLLRYAGRRNRKTESETIIKEIQNDFTRKPFP